MAKRKEVKQPREYTKRQLSHFKKAQRRQRIILISGISIIAAVVLIIIAGWFFGEYYPMNRTIATINDTRIKMSTFIDTMAIIAGNQQNSQQQFDLQSQSDYVLKAMVQYELNAQAAEKLGITISDEDIDNAVKSSGYGNSAAARAIAKASLLANSLASGYIDDQVPDSSNQVLMNAMLLEDAAQVAEVREKLLASDNFSALAEEFALNTVSKNSKGAFDWHPAGILKKDIGSAVPVDWAFSAEAKKGDISPALTDNLSSKKLGYWLINVTDRPEEGAALVKALLVSSKTEADYLKPLLEATDNISSLADQYTQYSRSKSGHGDMGEITDTENVSAAFNGYVFNPDIKFGEWSEPIKDDTFWTTGGSWIVQIVDKEENRDLSAADENQLISEAYENWSNGLWTDASLPVEYSITDEQKQWAIEKATAKIS